MKRIGLLGGMSWESTIEYYRLVNELVAERLGGLHSADCLLRSVDFADIEVLQREDRWDEAGEVLAREAQQLEAAGAELLVLCTNTMHKLAPQITAAIGIPFVHIADTTADAVKRAGLTRVGLLATAYTMEQEFYVGRLREHGLEVVVPDAADRKIVHDVIYQELCVGIVDDASREEYRRIMRALAADGAQGILLGCTEIDLLVGAEDSPVPVFDTTRLHAEKAVELSVGSPRVATRRDAARRAVAARRGGASRATRWDVAVTAVRHAGCRAAGCARRARDVAAGAPRGRSARREPRRRGLPRRGDPHAGRQPERGTDATVTSATSGWPASSATRARPPISVIETTSAARWFWAEEGGAGAGPAPRPPPAGSSTISQG